MAEQAPSLILLDLMMPVMDGFEFVMEMHKLDSFSDIPVVVVTAKDITEEDRRRLNGGVVGLIEKGGLDRESLLAQLREQVAATSLAAARARVQMLVGEGVKRSAAARIVAEDTGLPRRELFELED